MDEGRGQDQYEERLKEVFNSFDTSGRGSLSSEELSDLCRSLHLDDAQLALLHRLLQNQDHLRVDFDQFKDALILVLSSTIDPPPAEHESFRTSGGSPEIQPKFVKGGKRYGRRSTPEFMEPDPCDVPTLNPADDLDLEDNDDSAVPRKRERWNAHGSSSEEYEAEGQMHLWNPDEPSAPRGSAVSQSGRLEERLREACDELAIAWDGRAAHDDLLTLSEHLDLQLNGDVLLSLSSDGAMNVQEFVSMILNHNKPPTASASASTPYRQLKRQHSTQPFDEEGRRISTMPSTIGVRLFSLLDDGSGFTQTESILDIWTEEGIENSAEILQALNFDVEGKLSLGDLTAALENELLVTKNGVFQAALSSFKAEIRHLRERIDQEVGEKEKVQFDLERAEKQKTQLAAEVDERHSAIEHTNNINLQKLDQDYKEKLAAVRSELVKEMEQLQQQAVLQREELGAEMEKIREDDALLRHHLSVSVSENRRLEVDLLDCTEKLAEARSQINTLQTNLENITKDKFGDLNPGSADLLYEERVHQLHSSYQVQCRELQDRIDELQAELQGLRVLDRAHEPCGKTLSDELESKSPGTESDPGIGSDEVQTFSMSLEAEMMLEQLKEQHRQEMEDLRNQLENEISEFDRIVEKQKTAHEDQKAALMLQHQQEVQMLKDRVVGLQSQLQQAVEEHTCLEENQVAEMEERKQREEEVGNLRQQLLEAHTHIADLEDKLNTLEDQQAETDENFLTKMEELRNQHAVEMRRLKEEQADLLEATLAEKRNELQELKTELEREKDILTERLKVQLEEAKQKFEEERDETVKNLNERWQKDREEENHKSLQVLLEEQTLRLVRKQEEKEKQLREQWESERAHLQEHHEEVLLHSRAEDRLQLQEEFELRESRLKEKLEMEKEQRVEMLLEVERALLEENHREAVKELMEKHAEERDALSAKLTELRHDIAEERREVEICFIQRIREVEDRFSDDQESAAKRFQAHVSKVEEVYRRELTALSESLALHKLHWEAEMQTALERAEEQRKAVESLEQEKERLRQEWELERQQLELIHGEETDVLKVEFKHLQKELDEVTSEAQRKEIKLSMQLNELHHRLQEQHQLLAQSQSRVHEMELLLNRTVEAKSNETLSTSERRRRGQMIQPLTELQDSKVKVQDELQEHVSILDQRLGDDQEVDQKELQMELDPFFCFVEKESNDMNVFKRENPDTETRNSFSGEESSHGLDGQDDDDDAADDDVDQMNVDEDRGEGGFVADPDEGWVEDAVEQEDAGRDSQLRNYRVYGKERDHEKGFPDLRLEDPNPERGDLRPERGGGFKRTSEPPKSQLNKTQAEEMHREATSSLQMFDGSCSEETRPGVHCEDDLHHGTVVFTTEETSAPAGQSDPRSRLEDELDGAEPPDKDRDRENQESIILKLQTLSSNASEKNVLLHKKIYLLQQKTEVIENLLARHDAKLRTSRQALEKNHDLQVVLMERVNELQRSALKRTLLQMQFEDCVSENSRLKEQAGELQKKGFDFQDQPDSLVDKICRTSAENARLLELWSQLGGRELSGSGEVGHPAVEALPTSRRLQTEVCCKELEEQNAKLRRAISELQDESEVLLKTTRARRYSGDDAEVSAARRKRTSSVSSGRRLVAQSAASCLAEENVALRTTIAALKDGDIKKFQDELTRTLEDLRNEKFVAQQAADNLKKQISELSFQSHSLEDENEMLTEKNAQNAAGMESMRQQLLELLKETQRSEADHAADRKKMAACVSALEAELTKALEDAAQLEKRKVQLSQQLSELREKTFQVGLMESQLGHLEDERRTAEEEAAGLRSQLGQAQEKVRAVGESLQAVNRQTTRLKSELQVLQQERDFLKHEVSVLHKQLQNSSSKNHILEVALQSNGSQNLSKKLFREELSWLMGQEQQLLRQENSRLQAEVHIIKSTLLQSKEKVRQLNATVLLLNKHEQQSQLSAVKALEEENASLKQELELAKGCDAGRNQADVESLLQENEALKAQMAQLSSQVLESFHAQWAGLLPPSPHRVQRGPHRGEEPDHLQQVERERKMRVMEQRMKEIELSLRNVKLLLKEKVAQLKDQLHRNGKADVLIKDLYTENTQLLKALEITEQRQKIAEKKNYLLEEKISSLNKIVRDLNPSTLPGSSYSCQYP